MHSRACSPADGRCRSRGATSGVSQSAASCGDTKVWCVFLWADGPKMAERTKATAPATRPVPMKLFATWEVDRTAPNCIPR